MKKVLISSIVPSVCGEMLKNDRISVIQNMSYKNLSPEEIIDFASDCQGMVTLLSDKIDKYILNKLPDLKIISNYAVGYNNIDIKTATQLGIKVTNTPDVLTEATSDLAMALLLSCARRLIPAHKFVINGKFEGWQSDLFLGKDLNGKIAGIIGLGRIGKSFAGKIKSFNTRVIYYDRKRDKEFEKSEGIEYVNFQTLIKTSDIISLHVPLNTDTKRLFNKITLSQLKDGVILINTSRGEVIEEKALIKYLKNGKIFAAGLDVYEYEPKITKELFELDNVVLLPHIGSATIETRNKMAEMAAKNIIQFFKTGKAISPVN